ncbi:hypothetical protein CMV_003529 [Castanea mollissima]|uniref:Uncharacterized protein n=1 Tax=Castanea mollissima TaxID=60419 RepID=A0A8J4RNS2_9ROSI|nr:hypothetical protein CMV_003529 [Castanea mollissima]
MGFILCVKQEVSMYKYSWGPSQATLDQLASSPCRTLHPIQGLSVSLLKPLLGCHIRAIALSAVTLAAIALGLLGAPIRFYKLPTNKQNGWFQGSLWKMHHWNEQRKVRQFYDLLEKG